jgi:type IV secretion system protein VirB1
MIIECLFVLTTFCVQCGPSVDPSLTKAIIRVESGGNPFAIGDNTARRSYFPVSKADAVQLAGYLLSQGHNLDMGLMQINSCHLGKKGLSLDALFDPCGNVNFGTSLLADYFRMHSGDPDKTQVLFKALSAYNTGSAWRGPDYINRILTAINAPYRVAVVNPPKERKSKGLKASSSSYSSKSDDYYSSPLFFPGGNL